MCNKECSSDLTLENAVECSQEQSQTTFVAATTDKSDLADVSGDQIESISFGDLIKRVEKAGVECSSEVVLKHSAGLVNEAYTAQVKSRVAGVIEFVYMASQKILSAHMSLEALVAEMMGHIQRLGIDGKILDVNSLTESTEKQKEILTDFLGEVLVQSEALLKSSKTSIESFDGNISEEDLKKAVDSIVLATKSLEKEAKPAINKMVVFSSRLQHAITCKISVLSRLEKVAAPQAAV